MISDGPLDSKGVRFAVEFVACQLLAVSHVFVGLLAAAAIVGMLGISGKPVTIAVEVCAYFLGPVLISGLLGYWIASRFDTSAGSWVWIPPTIYIVWIRLRAGRTLEGLAEHFTDPMLFLLVTSPLLSAICFGIAYRRRFSGKKEPARR